MKPTYKELKLCQSFLKFATNTSLKPTYKELKQNHLETISFKDESLKPTYKELKLHNTPAEITAQLGFEAYL